MPDSEDLSALAAVLDEYAAAQGSALAASADLGQAVRAARALGQAGAQASPYVASLIRVMHADPRGAGEVAPLALGRIGGEAAIRELNRIWFSGWDRKLCEACSMGLSALGAGAHEVLLRLAADDDALTRARALQSLRESHYPDAPLSRLAVAALSDSSCPNIDNAINVLSSLEAPDLEIVVPALADVRDSEHHFDDTRRAAARLLDTLTGRSSPA
jgi:hypothetical protein